MKTTILPTTMIDLLRAPADAGAGAGAGDPPPPDGGAGAGDPPPPDGGAGDPPPPDGGAGDPPPSARWFEADGISQETRDFLTAKGLATDDPAEAAAKAAEIARNAEKRLGHPADRIMLKPKDDTPLGDFMRENAEIFGVPDSPEGYEITKPEGWEGEWDAELEAEARTMAHEMGLPGAYVQQMAELYAGKINGLLQGAATDLATATEQMNAELQKAWGADFEANSARARQAFQVVAERAGLDADAQGNVLRTMAKEGSDANVLRTFAAIGEMLGEDAIAGLGKGGGMAGMTAAQARAELHTLRQPGGDYHTAYVNKDYAKLNELSSRMASLQKIASGEG